MQTRFLIIIALLGFWIFLAWRAFERGNSSMAIAYVGIGIALTVFRLMKAN